MEIYRLYSLSLPLDVALSRSGCHASASMHFREFWQWPSLSVTQWRFFPRPVLLLFSSDVLYPTPFLPPMGFLFCSPSCFLNHSKIFGWFLVRFSPFLRTASSRSFLIFSFCAAFSFFSFAFSSLFLLNSSFLFLALCRVLPLCWLFVTCVPSSPGFGLGSELVPTYQWKS